MRGMAGMRGMTATRARVRLRGMYAILAGGILLIVVPVFQALFLASEGYIEAVAPVASRRDFGPLLAWSSQHAGAEIAYHLLQLVPFLLIIGLPSALRRALWARGDRASAVEVAAGVAGVLAYAVAIVIGIVATVSDAAAYASGDAAGRSAVAASFAGSYALTTTLSHIIGGTLLALSIALASWRMVRTQLLLPWVGYLGLILAALLVITAIQFSADTMQVETTLSPFSFATLALWLICIGVLLSSLRALPEEGAAGSGEDVSEVTDTGDSADSAPNPQ